MAKKTNSKKTENQVFESENIKLNVRAYENGKTKGFATITFYDAITIYNCTLVEGKDGLFLSMPSYKGNDGNYYNYAFINKDDEIAAELNVLLQNVADVL